MPTKNLLNSLQIFTGSFITLSLTFISQYHLISILEKSF